MTSTVHLCPFYVRPPLRSLYNIIGRVRLQLALGVSSRSKSKCRNVNQVPGDMNGNPLKKCIREDNVIKISTRGVVQHVFVDEEQ
jgi:hypothetical protein